MDDICEIIVRIGGYYISIAQRLNIDKAADGALNFNAELEDSFEKEEIENLAQLAGDLAYGINNLRGRQERKHAGELTGQIKDDPQLAPAAGCSGYIERPFSTGTIMAEIEKFL